MPSLSRIKRHCTIQNLLDGKLACCVFLQVSIFAVALWFAIHVHFKGYVNLPSSAARAAIDNPRITSYVVTLVATVIAFLNTFLLGLVLQAALTARLSHPLSLQTLRGSISLITAQPLVGVRGLKIAWAWVKSLACMRDGRRDIAPGDVQYWTWLKYTLMYSILCGQLTSSWTSFLAPTPVDLQFHFTGTAVDYSVAAAQLQATWKGYVAPYPSESSPLATYMNVTRGMQGFGLTDVTLYTQAGNAAASTELGSPYYIPYQGVLYNGSTGGILINASTMTQNASSSIPLQYTTGWTRSYTTAQQGLSADVQCRQQAFLNAADTYPNVGVYENTSPGSSITAPNQVFTADYYIQSFVTITNCSSDSVAYTSDILALVDIYTNTRLGDGVLIGSVCKYQDFEKATNQSFLVLLQGFAPSYSFITPTICQVSPLITSVNVGFDGTTVNMNGTTDYEPLDPGGQQAPYIDQISDLIWMMMFDTQSLSGNSMATGIQMIGANSHTWNSDSLNSLLENYLRGGVEFLGTVWQRELQSLSNTSMTQYPAAVHVQTLGYEYHRSTYLLLLVPLAVVVIITCTAAVYTPASKPQGPGRVSIIKDERIEEKMDSPGNLAPHNSIADSEDFNPTNIIHLMMLGSRSHLENEAGENELLRFHLD
ncbi:hypothetical protein DEU56DRAFT_573703 [Suillus clintonianus]|uniref:uncharacterized protein n=1 Tax=Suillus clintonianus TaxID=1904413 RepID=UPI001B87C216|nr:uncharacterized protein DEU56DRAFT_573703 [Suillus clintonianus]KAG2125399.1 hypothetical protein DEU56DRAFT_573703 [Suillus clintonianus]